MSNISMKVQNGVRIYLQEGISKVDRIQLSSGVIKAQGNIFTRYPYCSTAVVPERPWRAPSAEESATLYTDTPLTDYNNIGLIRVPDDVLEPLYALGLNRVENANEIRAINDHDQYETAIQRIKKYLHPYILTQKGLVIHEVACNIPCLETVTFDPKRRCFIGIHLDSWDGLPFERRSSSRNRICINLGNDDRYFLFINLTLAGMLSALRKQDQEKCRTSPKAIGYTFMEQYPDYPVIKIRVKSGEAYVAPTENMFHDGCSIEHKSVDIALMIRGFFRIFADAV